MLKLGKIGTHAVLGLVTSALDHYQNGKYAYSIRLSVGLARGGNDSFCEIKGKISTGSSLYGDRPCFHTDVDGLVYASTSACRMIPQPCGFGFTLKNKAFTEIITGPCDRVLSFFTEDYRGNIWEHLYYYGLQGDNLYHGYTYRKIPTIGPPALFPRVTFYFQTYNTLRTLVSKLNSFSVAWKGDFEIPLFPNTPTTSIAKPAVTLDTTAKQFDDLYNLVHRFINSMNLKDICPKAVQLPPSHPIYGDLAVKALDSAKFIDANLFAFLSEYQSLSTLFQGIGKDAIQGRLAEAYLGYNYGLRNQVSDYISIVQGLEKTLKVRERQPLIALRASHRVNVPGTMITKEYHYKIRYRPQTSQGGALLRTLREYSLLPTFSAAWDLVPFSFVMDWFYSFQRELDRFQFRTDYLLYDIVAITKSEKTTFTIADTSLADEYADLNGIVFTNYSRSVSNVVDLPSYFFTDGYTPNFHRHIADIFCLLMKQ